MILPNLAFDALLFGALLLATAIDSAFPVTHGAVSLLVVGGATYWAAQELAEWLLRRTGWSQESLATSLSLCVAGFLYFWLRNQSDLALLALSIGLMMGSLMLAISVLGAINGTFREGKATPLLGWLATALLSLLLGIAVGFVILFLGQSGMAMLPYKIGALAGALVLWKLREIAPPQTERIAPFPQRGTLLDRLVPVLILGMIALIAARGSFSLDLPTTPAVAATSNAPSAADGNPN